MNIVYTDIEKKSYNNIFWLNKDKNKRPNTKQQNYSIENKQVTSIQNSKEKLQKILLIAI